MVSWKVVEAVDKDTLQTALATMSKERFRILSVIPHDGAILVVGYHSERKEWRDNDESDRTYRR